MIEGREKLVRGDKVLMARISKMVRFSSYILWDCMAVVFFFYCCCSLTQTLSQNSEFNLLFQHNAAK